MNRRGPDHQRKRCDNRTCWQFVAMSERGRGAVPSLGLATLAAVYVAIVVASFQAFAQTSGTDGAPDRTREAPVVLRPGIDPVELTPAQRASIDTIRRSPERMQVNFTRMPGMAEAIGAASSTEPQAGRQTDGGARFVVPMRDGGEVALVRRRPTIKFDGGLTWRGAVETTGERAIIMLWKDGRLSGHFSYKGKTFVLCQTTDGVHAVTESELAALPPDHSPVSIEAGFPTLPMTPPAEPRITPISDERRRQLEANVVTIDVMLLYTRAAASYYIQDAKDLLALAIESANESFASSGLDNVRLRLVHAQEIGYVETGREHFDHLYRMVDGIEPFGDVKRLRNEKRADVVGLIMHSPEGCGLATRVGADSEDAFFVVHHTCAAVSDTIAHEIGHLLGARHDRSVDPMDSPHPYGHGYVNGTKWRDIMSYRQSCDGCPRKPFWSNPRMLYQGEPMGTLASDNARVILENAERVSQFR